MAEYGSDEDGGFNASSKAYKLDPSLEHYLRLRRERPDAEIEVAVLGGIDQLFYLEPELKKFGIDPDLVASAMDANPDAISELSLQLMEKIIEARSLAQDGRTHLVRRGLAIPDKLVNWLIGCMLDGLSWNDELYIPRDLIVLIRERLSGSNPEYEQASHAHQRRWSAILIGAQLHAQGIEPSFRMLAKALGVAPSTVKRWFPSGEFNAEVERISAWFDKDGKPRPAKEIFGRPLRRK